MKLVIVESPAKAKTINKYLGNSYKVLASFGHVRDLPSKDGSVRPDEDFAMDYEISSDSLKHVKMIADATKQSDSIYLATDPDREGEAISWHIVEALKAKKLVSKDFPIHRISFNEITKRAVTEAIEHPRSLDMDLVNAQQARRALDYLVGFNLSPVLWRKLPGSKSAGRVQSVALRLICEREHEIEQFIPKEYWDVWLDLNTAKKESFVGKVISVDTKKLAKFDLSSEADAKSVVDKIASQDFYVKNVETKDVKRHPKPPFTTSSLQQEASRKLGFGAKRTMSVAQKLYEGINLGGETVGLITYMRTDGVSVSQEAIGQARRLVEHDYGANYVPEKPRFYASKIKNAQEAHEAIRPTDLFRKPKDMASFLDKDQLRLYELIWKRMVSSQMASVALKQVQVDSNSDDDVITARSTGSTITFDGFYKLYKEGVDDADDDSGDVFLPPLKEGEKLAVQKVRPEQHFTKPPPRFSEASLVKKLEELGIGRPSTYASIISVLQDRSYVRLDKRRFVAEDRGRIVTAFLSEFFKRYVEYDFTAQLEEKLDEVSEGKINWKQLLAEFWQDFHRNVGDVKEQDNASIHKVVEAALETYVFDQNEDGSVNRKCPTCDDGELSLKMGKFGAFVGCSNYPDCRFTRPLSDEGDEDGEEGKSDKKAQLNEPKLLGQDPVTGLDITLRKGPYGFYVQLGEQSDKKNMKRSSVPKIFEPLELTFEQAVELLTLPREVGTHPETGKVIKANFGRYGGYLQHDGKYASIADDEVLSIGINRAVIAIAESAKKKGIEPLRVLGSHPKTNEELALYKGRYGPYIKLKGKNVTIPKTLDVDTLSLEEAIELVDKAPAKKTKKKAAAKKAPAKQKKKA